MELPQLVVAGLQNALTHIGHQLAEGTDGWTLPPAVLLFGRGTIVHTFLLGGGVLEGGKEAVVACVAREAMRHRATEVAIVRAISVAEDDGEPEPCVSVCYERRGEGLMFVVPFWACDSNHLHTGRVREVVTSDPDHCWLGVYDEVRRRVLCECTN